MTQEEKVKRYDEALHKAKNYYSTTDSSSDIKLIGLIFPELKESDDEKIRKALVEMVHDTTGDSLWIDYNVHKEDALAWLEKQGEQKSIDDLTQQEAMDIAVAKCFEQDEQNPDDKVEPKFKVGDYIKPIDKCLGSSRIIEEVYDGWYVTDKGTLYFEFEDNWELVEQNPAWSEEDETTKNNISHIIRQYDKISKKENQPCWYVGDCLLWMQNIKDRVQPQPKHEWSEEDERIYKVILELMDSYSKGTIGGCIISPNTDRYIKWFKSLKARYTWKPSDEQMERLKGTINSLPHQEVLYSLYQDLKKLREK